MCSSRFTKTDGFSFSSFTLYPQPCLWLLAEVKTSLSNQGALNCTEHLIAEESRLQHLKRENYLSENRQDTSVYTIRKHNGIFAVTSYCWVISVLLPIIFPKSLQIQ